MKPTETDEEIKVSQQAASAFLANGDPTELGLLALPPAEAKHFAGMMKEWAHDPHVAARVLGGAARWLALQGNAVFGFGAASVLNDYWSVTGSPGAAQADRLGDTVITMALACNRCGQPEVTLNLAGRLDNLNPSWLGGEQVAAHLAVLAAEAHWLKREFESARRRMDALPEPAKNSDAAPLWRVMRRRLDEMTTLATTDEQPSLKDRWKTQCDRHAEHIGDFLLLAPAGQTIPWIDEMKRVRGWLEQEASSPPKDEAELISRGVRIVEVMQGALKSAFGQVQ